MFVLLLDLNPTPLASRASALPTRPYHPNNSKKIIGLYFPFYPIEAFLIFIQCEHLAKICVKITKHYQFEKIIDQNIRQKTKEMV